MGDSGDESVNEFLEYIEKHPGSKPMSRSSKRNQKKTQRRPGLDPRIDYSDKCFPRCMRSTAQEHHGRYTTPVLSKEPFELNRHGAQKDDMNAIAHDFGMLSHSRIP